MDVLEREKAKLEVMQCSTLSLFPSSVTILAYTHNNNSEVPHPLATHRITLNIQYADTLFSVLVTMEHPLDFFVNSPLLLPMKYLDDKPFPPNFPNTSLVELIKWLISHVRNYMKLCISEEEQLSGLASAVDNLINLNIITPDEYEMVLIDNKATLLVKFRPEKDLKLACLTEMVKEDKLLNTGGHFFVFKMVFRKDTGTFLPGDFSMAFSSDISNMLPEIASYSYPGLTDMLANNLVEFLLHVRDMVNKAIMEAAAGWEKRSKLLLHLFSVFEDKMVAVPFIDGTQMSVMNLAFRSKTVKSMLKIEVTPEYPAVLPKVTWVFTVTPAGGARETIGSGVMKEKVLSDKDTGFTENMEEHQIVKAVLDLIKKICHSDKLDC